jgi:hypothetical protein
MSWITRTLALLLDNVRVTTAATIVLTMVAEHRAG